MNAYLFRVSGHCTSESLLTWPPLLHLHSVAQTYFSDLLPPQKSSLQVKMTPDMGKGEAVSSRIHHQRMKFAGTSPWSFMQWRHAAFIVLSIPSNIFFAGVFASRSFNEGEVVLKECPLAGMQHTENRVRAIGTIGLRLASCDFR